MLNAGVKRQIAVVGLGYAGLPLALAFSQHNRVVGYDTDESRIEELKRAFDRNRALSRSAISASSLKVTAAIDDVSECDFYIIVVPTPVTATKKPDLDHLIDATTAVGRRLKKGDIVVYESTVYPGATEDLCIPILERESNLKSPTDFAVGYSPERVSCGDTDLSLHNTVKVISAQTAEALEIIHTVYSTTIEAGLW